jgi:phospholipase/lecithinase/hemolysin
VKKQLLAAGIVAFSISLPLKASAATFSKLFVFGDSLSDAGNIFNTTRAIGDPNLVFPPSPPYSEGRLSNGPVWVEYLGQELGLSPTLVSDLATKPATQGINFAFGGSNSGTENAFVPNSGFPGVLRQIDLFTKPLQEINQKADPDALYVVWAGANDYLFGGITDPTIPVENINSAVQSLVDIGAKNIIVPNLPDLGRLPSTNANPIISDGLNQLTAFHNAGLNESLAGFTKSGVNIIPLDINTLGKQVQANPLNFGFKDASNSCLVGDFAAIANQTATLCSNPQDFFFFDGVHPSTLGHKLIAQTALASIKHSTTSIPEPSVGLGVFALATLAVAGKLKRKKVKQSIGVGKI